LKRDALKISEDLQVLVEHFNQTDQGLTQTEWKTARGIPSPYRLKARIGTMRENKLLVAYEDMRRDGHILVYYRPTLRGILFARGDPSVSLKDPEGVAA